MVMKSYIKSSNGFLELLHLNSLTRDFVAHTLKYSQTKDKTLPHWIAKHITDLQNEINFISLVLKQNICCGYTKEPSR